ncbi:hypothetical protein I309_02864 [Cryptococcus deuterogattii LA55]|nr:hypothetical protein I309_02864 [Cryptococcus deuterogattii LA55]KIR33487.1 hypothetical protein I352_04256 [Cryptococcus deuterogattii MMRL2647]KIR91741.1 hypothetical protein I304_04565 [Cryptococcus deuterogattii CBS 10090]KIR99161.1 hypothetical protein L804_03783 [Cryptococcus deuterogattii 2001/935-1]
MSNGKDLIRGQNIQSLTSTTRQDLRDLESRKIPFRLTSHLMEMTTIWLIRCRQNSTDKPEGRKLQSKIEVVSLVPKRPGSIKHRQTSTKKGYTADERPTGLWSF